MLLVGKIHDSCRRVKGEKVAQFWAITQVPQKGSAEEKERKKGKEKVGEELKESLQVQEGIELEKRWKDLDTFLVGVLIDYQWE